MTTGTSRSTTSRRCGISKFPATRVALIAGVLLLIAVALVEIAVTGWSGPAPAIITIPTAFFGPGLGWQNLRGNLGFSPARLGLAVATSIGVVIALGLGMSATSVTMSRSHWAAGLAAVLIVLAVAALVRPPQAAWADRPRPDADSSRRLAAVLIGVLCVVLAGAGAGIAWSSQQHWLARQHYTELYATATAGGEQVTVHNHEGHPVAYLARIEAAGDQVTIVRFTLDADGTWQRTIAVHEDQAIAGAPLLDVELGRVGVPGVYRWIRLLRPQPSASPSG